MALAHCPECNNVIRFARSVREGQVVTCNRCRAKLEVVEINPVEVDVLSSGSKKRPKNEGFSEAGSLCIFVVTLSVH